MNVKDIVIRITRLPIHVLLLIGLGVPIFVSAVIRFVERGIGDYAAQLIAGVAVAYLIIALLYSRNSKALIIFAIVISIPLIFLYTANSFFFLSAWTDGPNLLGVGMAASLFILAYGIYGGIRDLRNK